MLLGFALVFAWLFVLQVVEDPFSIGRHRRRLVEPGIFDEDARRPRVRRRVRRRRVRRGPRRRRRCVLVETGGTRRHDDRLDLGAVRRRLPGRCPGCSTSGSSPARPRRSSWPATSRCIIGIVAAAPTTWRRAAPASPSSSPAVVVAWLGALGGRRVTTIIGAVEIGLGVGHRRSATRWRTPAPPASAPPCSSSGAAIAVLAQLLHMLDRRAAADHARRVVVPAVVPGRLAGRHDAGRRCAGRRCGGSARRGRCAGAVGPPPAAGPTLAPPPPPPPSPRPTAARARHRSLSAAPESRPSLRPPNRTGRRLRADRRAFPQPVRGL